ncbi:MAG: hypothetical protein R2854_23655 [Caldilineaceae bacterium]
MVLLAGRPSEMALAAGVPGHGWKAATIDAAGFSLRAARCAPGHVAHAQPDALLGGCGYWPSAMGVHEALLSVDITEWHDYELVWTATDVRFHVDGALVLRAPQAPRGPLGCVIWLDNQFMVVRPTGVIRHGLVARGERE